MLKINKLLFKKDILMILVMSQLKCTKCKEIKNVEMFGKNRSSKSGYKYRCRECETETQRLRRNKEKEADPEKYHQKWADYYAKTKEKNKESKRIYMSKPENKEKRNEYIRKYKAEKRINDKCYVLYENLRKRIWNSINKKNNSSKELLGCEIEHYFNWISYTMSEEMTWDNYGSFWNIDHLIPIKNFNLENCEEAKKAFNWKNTWAMKATDNFSKNKKIIKTQIIEHNILLKNFINENSNLLNRQSASKLPSKGEEGSETR